jgi:hypothetical protein
MAPEVRTVSGRRRWVIASGLTVLALAVLGIAGWSAWGALHQPHPASRAPAAGLPRPDPGTATARAVPVLVYHEMDNGCKSSAATCKEPDPETVSTAQFTAEMAWLVHAGYHSVTLTQYLQWLGNPDTKLPAKPVLITGDNGIGNFLQRAQPILERDHFTATAFLVTGFADGAAGACAPKYTVAGHSYDVQPGCDKDNLGWDLTWAQLKALSPQVWEFSEEAGLAGHYVQTYDGTKCQMYDACVMPGETTAEYETRVADELALGITTLNRELPGRVVDGGWVVPYSDLGYKRCAQSECTPQPYTGPKNWLAEYAESHFRAVFVEDAYRNGTGHERFRFDIHGQDTLTYFTETLAAFTAAGDFGPARGG